MAKGISPPNQSNESQPKRRNTKDDSTPELKELPLKSNYQERAEHFLSDLDGKLKTDGIKTAVILIIDPSLDKPIIYSHGHIYHQAQAACDLARILKDQLIKSSDLTV